jgi:hypothetical protein
MSWAIAANWLAVFGTLVLTFGTGAQAWANLAEFKNLQASVSEDASDAIWKTLPDAELCRKAGADLEAIPAWIQEGRRRAAAARKPPHGGGHP